MTNMNPYQTRFNYYPLEAFYAEIADPAFEVMRITQTPSGVVGMEFVSVMALAAQGLYDLELPFGKISPLSLVSIVIAESGERLSEVHANVARSFFEFDAERKTRYDEEVKRYMTDFAIWKAVETGLRRALTKAAKEGEAIDEVQNELTVHLAKQPVKPKKRRTIREDTSEAAVMEALEGDGESIGFYTDEGARIKKNSPLIENIGLANKFWDGPFELSKQRGNGVDITARNPRVSVWYKVHPETFKSLAESHGGEMRSTGNWARTLIGCPESTQGTRFSDLSLIQQKYVHLPSFRKKIRDMLEEYDRRAAGGRIEREVLKFSEDARRMWINYSNEVEVMLQPTGYLQDAKDIASKAMELASRVAALLHVFSGQSGQISGDSLRRAMQIIWWHVREFKRIFAPVPSVQQSQIDAQTLAQYLHRRYWANGVQAIAKNEVLKCGPLRPSSRFEDALAQLVCMNQVWIQTGRNNRRFIAMNPQCFGPAVQMPMPMPMPMPMVQALV